MQLRMALVLVLLPAVSFAAIERVTLSRDGKTLAVEGEIVVEGQDGGVMVLAPDGVLWLVEGGELKGREKLDQPFRPLKADAIGKRLLAELPAGFKVHSTANYVVAYNTSKAYAEWCGALYERLHRAFFTYWTNQGWQLQQPQFPLVALVFDDQRAFASYARPELGAATNAIIGYYSMKTNRVTMYDLTGVAGAKPGVRISTAAQVNAVLSQPNAERTVATIVHEAFHQLAYNSGLQVRFADNPYWVSEGLAVFFESPDLKSTKGWSRIGAVNHVNLEQFQKSFPTRPRDSLTRMLGDDTRFRDPATAPAAYGEAWALNYYLLKTQPKAYTAYLKALAQQTPLVQSDADERVELFRKHLGDLDKLDVTFVRYINQLR